MFITLLLILAIASALVIRFLIRGEESYNKLISGQNEQIKKLEAKANEKNIEAEKLLQKQRESLLSQLAQLKGDFSDTEKNLIAQIQELKNQLKQSQDTLKKENSDKLSVEKKLQEAQAQVMKLDKELTSHAQVYEGLKGRYYVLERDIEKLEQELANKDSALKAEQSGHQELKDKYGNLLKQAYGSEPEKKEKDIPQEEAG